LPTFGICEGWAIATSKSVTRYGCRVQGATDVMLSLLDVLGYLDEIPICVAYEIDGVRTEQFPTTPRLMRAKPVYEVLPGWQSDVRGIKRYEELPVNCRRYVEFIESKLHAPIRMLSNGPRREEILYREA
jgi:adenylosuccinate synthase